MLIAARALHGMGAGGLTALVQIVMAAMIPPRELGRYAGVFGTIFAVATVGGPLIGGVIVDTSWLGWAGAGASGSACRHAAGDGAGPADTHAARGAAP